MDLKVDHDSLIPLHAQVEAMLRHMIQLPKHRNGAMLPKETDLAKRLGISRNTIRHAIIKLVNERLLVRKKGVGTTVANRNVVTHLESWHSFTQEMNEQGIAFKNFDIKVKKTCPGEKISQFFRIGKKKEVIELVRLRGTEEGPFVYFVSYFHPRIGLKGTEDFTQPLYELLEKDFSTLPVRSSEIIRAELAEARIAKKLDIKSKSPILVRERFVYDPGNRPIEYNLGYYRADKFAYSIDIRR